MRWTAAVLMFVWLPLASAGTGRVDAYPDPWRKQLRSAPEPRRTSASEANFRKSAPPSGSVRLSDAALTEVKAFLHQVRHEVPGGKWIASISWAEDRRSKRPNDDAWIDDGAGLVICLFRRRQVPPDVIDRVDGIDIVFSAPDPSIFVGKAIDLQNGKFVIRD